MLAVGSIRGRGSLVFVFCGDAWMEACRMGCYRGYVAFKFFCPYKSMSKIEPYSENYSVAHDILLFP